MGLPHVMPPTPQTVTPTPLLLPLSLSPTARKWLRASACASTCCCQKLLRCADAGYCQPLPITPPTATSSTAPSPHTLPAAPLLEQGPASRFVPPIPCYCQIHPTFCYCQELLHRPSPATPCACHCQDLLHRPSPATPCACYCQDLLHRPTPL